MPLYVSSSQYSSLDSSYEKQLKLPAATLIVMVTRGRTVAVGHQPGGEGENNWDEVLHHSARMRWHMCEEVTADQTHDDHQGKWNHLQSSSWWLCQCGNVHPWGVTQIWPLLRYSALRFLTFYVWGKWIFPFQGNSMECGMATGCVKIIKRAIFTVSY